MVANLSRVAMLSVLTAACSGVPAAPIAQSGAPTADIADPVPGIPDRGNDPAVVLIDVGGTPQCAGALIATDVVLTAAHCVLAQSPSASCLGAEAGAAVLRSASTLGVRRQDATPFSGPRVAARAVLVSPQASPCQVDVALLLLERPMQGVVPLAVRSTGVAQGDSVRTVDYDPEGAPSPLERVRDHVPVDLTSATQFLLREEPCGLGCGGPVIDESTGDLVGVLSRSSEGGEIDVAVRADAALSLIAGALAQSTGEAGSGDKVKKGPIDMGATCSAGVDCAAGVCVTAGSGRYCSRTCRSHDHCPTHFTCEVSTGAEANGNEGAEVVNQVCVES